MSNAQVMAGTHHWKTGEDMTGKTSGWLTVIEQVPRPADARAKLRGTWWRCRCRCGNEKIVPRQYITRKDVTSCGCKAKGPKKSGPQKVSESPDKEKPKRRRNTVLGMATHLEHIASKCRCASCGKIFERLSYDWAYKSRQGDRVKWYCTRKCLRAATNNNKPCYAAEA